MPLIARRYIQAFIGITMIGIGVAFNYMANLGLGPWGVLHDGISKTINISYGILSGFFSNIASKGIHHWQFKILHHKDTANCYIGIFKSISYISAICLICFVVKLFFEISSACIPF